MTRHPTWEDTVAALFAAPYWVPEAERDKVGANWRACMQPLLSSYESVRDSAVTIYEHLATREMPLVTDPRQFWPLHRTIRLSRPSSQPA